MTTNSPLTDLDLDEIDARAAHLYEYADLPDDAEILAGTEVPALVAEVRRLRAAAVVPAADRAADELTAEEARDLVDELGTDLYRAQDALAFVGECCDIADRDGRPVTTADVREWLKGARCGRQLLADAADRDALRDRIAEAAMRLGRPRWDADDLADAVLGVLPAPADRATVLREVGWTECSPEWLAAHPGECGTAPRVPGSRDVSHWHPQDTAAGRVAADTPPAETCSNCRGSGLDPRYSAGDFDCPDCPAAPAQPGKEANA